MSSPRLLVRDMLQMDIFSPDWNLIIKSDILLNEWMVVHEKEVIVIQQKNQPELFKT